MAIFREVKRVLHDSATCWIVLGDSYAGSGKGRNADGSHQEGGKQGTSRGTVEGQLYHTPAGQDLKPKDLCMIPARVALALQADGWWLRSDIVWAKCLSGGARVYAKGQKGAMPMTAKDMIRLDPSTVSLWDGEKWNQAVGWEEVPRQGDELEIELRNGARIGCTKDHKWPVGEMGLGIRAEDLRIGQVLKGTTLPEPEQPRQPSLLPDEKIGWFVGLYIAEGSQSGGTIQIASHTGETERVQRLKALADAVDGHCFTYQTSEQGMTININSPVLLGVLKAYVSGKTAKDKHPHTRCWVRSNDFLHAMLQGYLDGDGCKSSTGRWRVAFTKNDELAEDLRLICTRLGHSLRLRRCKHTMGDQQFPGWRGSLWLDPAKRRTNDFQIVAIRKSRARKFWHIMLKDAPHTFALTCGVLTKNSNPMPESVTDRCTSSYEHVFMLAKSRKYFWDQEAVREALSPTASYGGTYRAAAHLDKSRNDCDTFRAVGKTELPNPSGRNRRDVWTIPTAQFSMEMCARCKTVFSSAEYRRLEIRIEWIDGREVKHRICRVCRGEKYVSHFAVMPEALVEPMVKAGSSERGACPSCNEPWRRVVERGKGMQPRYQGKPIADTSKVDDVRKINSQIWREWKVQNPDRFLGWRPSCDCGGEPVKAVVLDPFAGSGTTLLVARRLGRSFVGVELNSDYIKLAQHRLRAVQPMLL